MNPSDFTQLTSWSTQTLLPLFSALEPRLLQVTAALTGQTQCSVYVDHVEQPRAAALRIGICWYIAGNPSSEFLQSVNRLLPRDTFSVLLLDSLIMSPEHSPLGASLYFVKAKSRYAIRTLSCPLLHPLSTGYYALPVNQPLLEGDLEGAANIRDDILHFWTSMEVFDRDGFGFVIVKDGRIVSHSLTSFSTGQQCEIGVQTDPEHRLRGLGAHVASLTANEAFKRGMTQVGWMSWANNAGSVAISNRVGFLEECVYDVFINHWPAGNPQDMTADEFRAFANEYDRQFAENPPRRSGYPHIVAATARALAGESDSCRSHLHCAIDIGWLKTMEQLRSLWPELFHNPNVLQNEEWQTVFSRLE
jgi:RimJ/RimL family protein N-acetyltransferase